MARRHVMIDDERELDPRDEMFERPEGRERPEPLAPPPPPPMPEPDDDLSALEGDGWVRVSRVSPEGDMMFLRKMEKKILAEDITFIARTWGGGRYWLEIQNQYRQWAKKKYITFDPREYGPAKGAATPTKDGSVGPLVTSLNEPDPMVASQVAAVTAANERKDAEIAKLNERLLVQQQKNHDDMMALFAKTMTAPRQDSIGFDQMLQMAQVMNGGARGSGDLGELVKTLGPVFVDILKDSVKRHPAEAASRAVAVSPGASMLERIGIPLLETLGNAIARGIATQASRPQPPLQQQLVAAPGSPAPATGLPNNAPLPAGAAVTPPAPPVVDAGGNGHSDEGAALVDKIKAHPMTKMVAPLLLGMAKNQTPADAAAETIDKFVPEAFWPVVVELVNKPDLVQYLGVFEPEILNYGSWLVAVADTLKRDYIETEEEVREDAGDDLEAAEPVEAVAPAAAEAPVDEPK